MRWIIEICVWKDFIWLRGKGVLAGLGGQKARESESIHVCITFMCTCACQTSQCVRLGTPVMLTGSDSPRPDQQALAHCTAWALLCGERAQLRGQCHSLCHCPGQRCRSRPAVAVEKESVCVWVCIPRLTGIPVTASCCCCLWRCSLLALTPACFFSLSVTPLPPLPSTYLCQGHCPYQSLAGVSLVSVFFPCSVTLCSALVTSNHYALCFQLIYFHHNYMWTKSLWLYEKMDVDLHYSF